MTSRNQCSERSTLAASDTAAPRGETPLDKTANRVLRELRSTSKTADGGVACSTLITIIGRDSHVLAIMIAATLNLLPGPPGYSTAIGLAIIALALLFLRGRPIQFWHFIGTLRISTKLLAKLIEALAGFLRIVGNVSHPRFEALATGRYMRLVTAILALACGVGMLIPIPFTNFLPSLGLASLCVGILNRDGMAVLIGLFLSMLGIVVVLLSLWLVVRITFTVGQVLQHDLPFNHAPI